MKKIIALLLTAASLFAFSTACFAANPSVYLNGEKMTFEVEPFIDNNRTLVPMRAIFEAVGATIQWDEETKTVIGVKQDGDNVNFVTLQVGSPTAFINSAPTELDAPPVVVNDRAFVPLRFVVESLGEKVEWDQEAFEVKITTD